MLCVRVKILKMFYARRWRAEKKNGSYAGTAAGAESGWSSDAGGQGLIVFLEGCLAGFRGEDAGELHLPPSKPSFANFIEMEVDLENPYCTEFIVKEAEVKEDVLRSTLQPLGNSLIVAVVGDIVKVHIHTKLPGWFCSTA